MNAPSQIAAEAEKLISHANGTKYVVAVIEDAINKATEEWKEKWYLADGVASLAMRRKDEAEAACAQMRDALEFAKHCHNSGGAVPMGMILEALSTDCGKGMVPIEDVKPLVTGCCCNGCQGPRIQAFLAKHGGKLT